MNKAVAIFLLVTGIVMNTTKMKAQNLAGRVTDLTVAMINPDEQRLNSLVSENLTYGHSNGIIENKKEFISSLVSGKYNFISIDITNQEINISDKTAIVRHNLFANTHDKDKPKGSVKLKVLQVWQCGEDNEWVLIARQAVKNID